MKRSSLRAAAILSVGFVGVTVFGINSAQATMPYTSAVVKYGQSLMSCSGSGAVTTTGTSAPSDRVVAINGASSSGNWGGTKTFAPSPATYATQSYSIKTSVRTTTAGSNPATIEASYNASFGLATTGVVDCSGSPDLWVQNTFTFTATQPLLATITLQGAGDDYLEAKIAGVDSNNVKDDSLFEELQGTHSETLYLPAGTYSGWVEGDLYRANVTGAKVRLASTGSAKFSFAVAGSAQSGPSGTAAPYVSLAKSRNCAAGTLQTTLTGNATRAKQISKVVYSKNGHVVRTVTGRAIKRGLVVKYFGLAPTAFITAKATAILKSGRRLTESATYRPCAL